MRKSLPGAAVLVLAITSVLLAQDSTTITGKVVSVDPSAGTFVVESGTERFSITTNSSTMLMSKSQHINLADLKVGDEVSVRATGDAYNRVANEVNVTVSSTLPESTGSSSNYQGSSGTTTTGSDTRTSATGYQSGTGTSAPSTYTEDDANRRLPRTGSPVPLIGLGGLLLIGFSLAVRAARRIAE